MKKLVVLLVFLALASAASAGYVVAFTTPGSTEVHSSDNIVVNLWTDDPAIIGVAIDAVSDFGTNVGASIGSPEWPAGWDSAGATTLANDGTVLIIGIYANQTGVPPTGMTGTLWTFNYHVPNSLQPSTMIHIGAYWDGTTYLAPEVANDTGTIYAPTDLVLHVVPEPITITLLGLGSLLMLRRKK